MSLLYKLLAHELGSANTPPTGSGLNDPWERSRTYKGWPFFIRYALCARYMEVKAELLDAQSLGQRMPLHAGGFKARLQNVCASHADVEGSAIWDAVLSRLLRASVFYSLLAMLLLAACGFLYSEHKAQALTRVFSDYVPGYANALHKRVTLIANATEGRPASARLEAEDSEAFQDLTAEVVQRREAILSGLQQHPFSRDAMRSALDELAAQPADVRSIRRMFNALNKTLLVDGLRFAVEPRVYVADCSAFATVGAARLRPAAIRQSDASRCHTTVLQSFTVDDVLTYQHGDQHYDVLVTHRLDIGRYRAGMLGFYANEASMSQVMQDMVDNHTYTTLHNALRFPPEPVILPDWMRDRYGIESEFSDQLRHWVDRVETSGYGFDDAADSESVDGERTALAAFDSWLKQLFGVLANAWRTTLETFAWSQPASDVSWPRAESLLSQQFSEAVIRHEVKHQINAREGLEPLPWVERLLGDVTATDVVDTTVDEVSAYLVSLGYGDDMAFMVLGLLLSAGLDVLIEMETAHFAAQVIITELAAVKAGTAVPVERLTKPKELVDAYRTMAPEEISDLARTAYERLFAEPFPVIERTKGR